jgi:hypothetical protein
MSQICKNCGAVIADGERMCLNCGKVLPKTVKAVVREGNQFSAINQGMYQNTQMTDVKRQFSPTMAASNQTYSKERNRAAKHTFEKNKKLQTSNNSIKMNYANTDFDAQANALRPTEVETGSGNESKSKLHPIANRIGWIIALLIFLYFAFGGIMILIARNDTYSYESSKKDPIVASTYAEAMHNYFDSGWWHYRITKGVYYTGKTESGDKYEIYFTTHDGERYVDKLYINGEKVESNNLMNSHIREMFTAPSKP